MSDIYSLFSNMHLRGICEAGRGNFKNAGNFNFRLIASNIINEFHNFINEINKEFHIKMFLNVIVILKN